MSPIVQATVKSKVGGEVELMPLREGQDVREGEVLARIDTRNLQAQYDRQLAAVERARADLDLATLNRDKNRTLLEKHYISQNTYEATESAYAGMRREPQARRGGCAPREDQSRRRRHSRAVRRHDRQATRAAGRESVAGLDHRDAGRSAPDGARSGSAGRRHSGGAASARRARFKVGGFGAREFDGEVQRINPITADGSRAITIYIAVPNPNSALKGGMFAQGALTLDNVAARAGRAAARRARRGRRRVRLHAARRQDRAHARSRSAPRRRAAPSSKCATVSPQATASSSPRSPRSRSASASSCAALTPPP